MRSTMHDERTRRLNPIITHSLPFLHHPSFLTNQKALYARLRFSQALGAFGVLCMARTADKGRSEIRHGRLKSQETQEAASAASDGF
jgi:hypothetical protein